jgi:hypothetical protein
MLKASFNEAAVMKQRRSPLAMGKSPILDGHGMWAQEAMRQRYNRYCRAFRVTPRPLLSIPDYISERGWITHIMEALIEMMKEGDLASAAIGIELLEEDGGFAFGRILKSNTARALLRCDLTESQKERIRTRVIAMLCRGFMPGEFRDYARLLRRIGIGAHGEKLPFSVDLTNPWAAWYVRYLLNENPGPKPDQRRVPAS